MTAKQSGRKGGGRRFPEGPAPLMAEGFPEAGVRADEGRGAPLPL